MYNDSTSLYKEPVQDYIALLTAKDEIIELLKSETAYLRAENTSLREENRELKLLPSPSFASISSNVDGTYKEKGERAKKSLWKWLFG